ncbi:hypothetical protein LMH73_004695 [Vibrio splendidus]|nr:hypothetical protein [Vibrio splendidus]MCC4882527.1 hypothetical protein [Vibrio splendidus]
MKFSGEYEIGLPVCIKGLDPKDFAGILAASTKIIDEHICIGNKMMREHITLHSMLTDKSSFEIIDLIEEGEAGDGYHVRVNAILPVEINGVKCDNDSMVAILAKVMEMVNMHVTCNDYTYRDLVDIEEVRGIEEIITYDVQHDEPTVTNSDLSI